MKKRMLQAPKLSVGHMGTFGIGYCSDSHPPWDMEAWKKPEQVKEQNYLQQIPNSLSHFTTEFSSTSSWQNIHFPDFPPGCWSHEFFKHFGVWNVFWIEKLYKGRRKKKAWQQGPVQKLFIFSPTACSPQHVFAIVFHQGGGTSSCKSACGIIWRVSFVDYQKIHLSEFNRKMNCISPWQLSGILTNSVILYYVSTASCCGIHIQDTQLNIWLSYLIL